MKKKMNNKGFSLVELIIVIAIMAVLVGVLAPAYTRYVENARKSRDVSAVDSVLTVVETALIDHSARFSENPTVTINVPNVGGTISVTVTGATKGSLKDDIDKTMGTYTMAGDWKPASGTASADDIDATVSGGTATFTNKATGNVVDTMEAYSAALGTRIVPPSGS